MLKHDIGNVSAIFFLVSTEMSIATNVMRKIDITICVHLHHTRNVLTILFVMDFINSLCE